MMSMSRNHLISIALIASTAAAGLAQTQGSTSALKGHDSNAPIDVAADRIEVQDRADRAVFAGNVKVRQDELTLDTARLTVAYSSGGGIQIRRLDASGGVVVRSPSETARGNFGIYDLDRKLITLIGAVQLDREGSQDQRLAAGDRSRQRPRGDRRRRARRRPERRTGHRALHRAAAPRQLTTRR